MAVDPPPAGAFVPLVVIPCLNEAPHIADVVRSMSRAVEKRHGTIVVVDGGSTDGTQEVVTRLQREMPRLLLMHNHARLQGPGINLAVQQHARNHTHLIRADAHCAYPPGFIAALERDAQETGASAVVVRMVARGATLIQRINAATQNASIGNGGSSHRTRGSGRYVDHGHHALIRLDAFLEIGGYDASFSHNEDAELDRRLALAGHRIWLSGNTHVTYFPRSSVRGIARQYFNHGRGRAKNMLKHRSAPNRRQVAVIALAPALVVAALAPLFPPAALPAALWITATLLGGIYLAVTEGEALLAFTGGMALVMHLSWSAGFWSGVIRAVRRAPQEALT